MVGVADPAQPDQPVLGFAAAGNGERRPLDRAAAPPGRGPRRLRASSRDGGAVVNRPPSPLTMLLSRHTRRREMLTLLTGAAALRPSTARSQPTRRLPRVGFLGATSASGHASQIAALLSGLRELGYIDGTNIQIEFRWAEGNYDLLPQLAAEYEHLKVDVLVNSRDPGNTCSQGRVKNHSHRRCSNRRPRHHGRCH